MLNFRNLGWKSGFFSYNQLSSIFFIFMIFIRHLKQLLEQ